MLGYKIIIYILPLLLSFQVIASKSTTSFELSYYHSAEKNTRLNEILNQEFQQMPSSSSLGCNNGEYWFKLVLSDNTEKELIAIIPTHNINIVKLYAANNGNLTLQSISGNKVQKDKLSVDYKFPALELKNLNHNTYYLKVEFPKEANFPFKLVSQKDFYKLRIDNQSFNSFYYGLVLMVLILNIFFYVKFKNSIFLYYTLFLFSMTLGMLLYDGSLINIFRTNNFGKHIEFLARLMETVTLILFSISFLNLTVKTPKFTKSTVFFPIIMVVFYVLFLMTDKFIFEALGDVLGISVFFILWVIGLRYIKKIPYAKFYVLGYLLIMPVGAYYFLGYGFGVWYIDGNIKLAKIASFIDILVFTYALSYRLKIRDEENENMVIELKAFIENSTFSKKSEPKNVEPYLQLLIKNNISSEPLSLRELEVFKAIMEGLTNTQIAEKLFISINTVKTHNRKIYKKLNISNKVEMKDKISSKEF